MKRWKNTGSAQLCPALHSVRLTLRPQRLLLPSCCQAAWSTCPRSPVGLEGTRRTCPGPFPKRTWPCCGLSCRRRPTRPPRSWAPSSTGRCSWFSCTRLQDVSSIQSWALSVFEKMFSAIKNDFLHWLPMSVCHVFKIENNLQKNLTLTGRVVYHFYAVAETSAVWLG